MQIQANALPEEDKTYILNNYNERIQKFKKHFSGSNSNNVKEEIIAYKTFLIYDEFVLNRFLCSKLRIINNGMLSDPIDPLDSQKHINTIVRYIVHIEDEKGIY